MGPSLATRWRNSSAACMPWRYGAVWTCGEGTFGALGHSDLLDRWVPTCIAPAAFGGAKIVFVAGGSDISFAVIAEGILYIWGTDSLAFGTLLSHIKIR